MCATEHTQHTGLAHTCRARRMPRSDCPDGLPERGFLSAPTRGIVRRREDTLKLAHARSRNATTNATAVLHDVIHVIADLVELDE